MTIRLDINFDEFEEWLTPDLVENALSYAGYDVELKSEYKYRKVSKKEKTTDIKIPEMRVQEKQKFTIISGMTKIKKQVNFLNETNMHIDGAA